MMIWSLDPGMETGLALLDAAPDKRPVKVATEQVQGGLAGVRVDIETIDRNHVIVCEKFSPRPGARSWKLNELEAIRIEGALEVLAPSDVYWRKPEQRKLIGDSLQLTNRFLREAGYWTEPKELGRPDANDANAAMAHAIGHLRDHGHIPTIEMLIYYGERLTEGSSE